MNFALSDFITESVRQMKTSLENNSQEPGVLEISGYVKEMLGIGSEFLGLRVKMLPGGTRHVVVRPTFEHAQFRCVWLPEEVGL